MRATPVFGQLLNCYNSKKYNGFTLEGGARSSKTTSIIQFYLLWAERQTIKKRVFIGRNKKTWTDATVYNDFINILISENKYNKKNHNKTKSIYTYFNVEFWFFGLDDPQKIHGLTNSSFWINEAMEIKKNDFDQLEMRCSEFFVIDYNPSNEEHWIYDSICTRPDVRYIHSTILDNPFVPANVRRVIMSYEPTEENIKNQTADKNKWEIYGLGKRAKLEGLIFQKWNLIKEIPAFIEKFYIGLDFGYSNNPTAIVLVGCSRETLYIKELCYNTGMINPDVAKFLKANNPNNHIIWADSEDPKGIQEIKNFGINTIFPVKKGAGSVNNGIDILKRYNLFITEDSINLIKEIRNYKWFKDEKANRYLNIPVKDNDHAMDALRYVALMELDNKPAKQNLQGMFF